MPLFYCSKQCPLVGKLLVRNFPDEKNSSSSPVWGVSSLRMWKSSNGEKIGWEMLLIKISLWGQWQIIILNGKNDVSKGNATKGRKAVLPLLVYILQPHNKFHLIFLISTLKYFLEMVHGPPGFFSSAPFFFSSCTPKCPWFMSTSSSSILFCIQQKVLWLVYPYILFCFQYQERERDDQLLIQQCGCCRKAN